MQDQPQDGEPVWLAELAHLALGADQAMLADPDQMDLRAEKAPRCTTPCGRCSTAPASRPSRWTRAAGACACRRLAAGHRQPAGRAGRRLNDWWKQDAETRPWRRLLNEIQMAWHDHPVNEARAARRGAGQRALAVRRRPPLAHRAARTGADPGRPGRAATRGRLAAWLDALPALDAQLRARSGKQGLPDAPTELLLLGDDRSVALT